MLSSGELRCVVLKNMFDRLSDEAQSNPDFYTSLETDVRGEVAKVGSVLLEPQPQPQPQPQPHPQPQPQPQTDQVGRLMRPAVALPAAGGDGTARGVGGTILHVPRVPRASG